MKFSVELVNPCVAETFCIDQGELSIPKVRSTDRCYALIDEESSKIASIAIIGNPISVDDQARFRTQILFTSFAAEYEMKDLHHELVVGLRLSGPIDLFDPFSGKLWNNPEVLLYIYKITSAKDDGYYIGRHVLRGSNLSLEDCESDGYWGSGGKRFQDWKLRVGTDSLRKEILSVHNDWESFVQAEFEAIGSLYATDINCKNYVPGGSGSGGYASGLGPLIKQSECIIHGICLFSGDKCCTCTSQMSLRDDMCEIHGLSIHRKESCLKCGKLAAYKQANCAVHGETTFSKNGCWACSQASKYSLKNCDQHGLSKHTGNTCVSCFLSNAINQRNCIIHGLTAHSGDNCYKCRVSTMISIQYCSVHGQAKHRGQACYKCISEDRYEKITCETHGVSAHVSKDGGQAYCLACKFEDRDSIKECHIHGLTLHFGLICYKCNAKKSVKIKTCITHGETAHRGDSCQKCVSFKKYSEQTCSTHGKTTFMSNKCMKCRKSTITMRDCETHGNTKFRGSNCCKCVANKRYSNKDCTIHGITKHSGSSCVECSKKTNSST